MNIAKIRRMDPRLRGDDKARNIASAELCNNPFLKGAAEQSEAGDLSDERTIILLDQSDIMFASLSVCGRQSLRKLTKAFDVIIIDEAGQAVEAEAILPLRFETKKLLVVGDPKQLPATTISPTAIDTHYDWSLMTRLIEKNRVNYTMLQYQYRMHPQIREFPSMRFYDNQLLDGQNIRTRENPLLNCKELNHLFPYSFINIQTGREASLGSSFYNDKECQSIQTIIKRLGSIPSLAIGIITFYRAQADKLRAQFKNDLRITVSTVDGFQGSECDLIIISSVRANPQGRIGFAQDFRRANVAITRARHGLIILGHGQTLGRGNHILTELLNNAEVRERYFPQSVIEALDQVDQLNQQFSSQLSLDNQAQKKSRADAVSNPRLQTVAHSQRNCHFFAKGYCKKGDQCDFKHELSASTVAGPSYKK